MSIGTHTYTISSSTPNSKVDEESLFDEIYSEANITIALSNLSVSGDTLTINFKDSLNSTAKTALDNLIANHLGEPLERPVPTLHYVEDLPQGGSRVTDKGFSFVATANTETTFNYNVAWDWYVKDGSLWTYGAGEDDTISMSIALPEGGPDLHYYLEDIPVDKNGEAYAKNKAITETNLNGLTIRMRYLNTTQSDVKVKVVVRAYQQ